MSLKNQRRFFEAMEFANWAHRDQKRKLSNAPYIVHVFHGISLLLSHGVSADDPQGLLALIAFCLHDTKEDNPKEVSIELIRKKFGRRVAKVVQNLTLDPKNPNKQRSREKILRCGWATKIDKIADILSHTIALIASIEKLGLRETQKHFKQSIEDRIRMERWFLVMCSPNSECAAFRSIWNEAINALLEL